MIQLYELGGAKGQRFSTFSWRINLALHHKGLPFETVPVRASDKAAIAFSGQKLVPILRDGETIVSDSWRIAKYLETTYPDHPSLFGGPVGESMTRFFNIWVDRQIVPALLPSLAADVLGIVDAEDAQHLRKVLEGFFKKPLEELATGRDQAMVQLRRLIGPVRKLLDEQPFVAGNQPAYADHILFGTFQWSRVVSNHVVLEPGDAVFQWFERMLDQYGGVGRREPARRQCEEASS